MKYPGTVIPGVGDTETIIVSSDELSTLYVIEDQHSGQRLSVVMQNLFSPEYHSP